MRQISADWISVPIVTRLANSPSLLRVLSVHKRALNLIDERGQLVAIVDHFAQMGPFHLSVPALNFAEITTDDWVDCNGHSLTVNLPGRNCTFPEGISFPSGKVQFLPGRCAELDSNVDTLVISIAAATRWSPIVDWPTWTLDSSIAQCLYECIHSASEPHKQALPQQRFGSALNAAIDHFRQALAAQASDQLSAATTQLAGLGIGLTPAGDDFLLGAIAALYAITRTTLDSERRRFYASLPEMIAQIAIPRTTRLSAQWLRCAAQGEFSWPWHQLAKAMSEADHIALFSAIRQLAAIGATSGLDALTGFYCVIEPLWHAYDKNNL